MSALPQMYRDVWLLLWLKCRPIPNVHVLLHTLSHIAHLCFHFFFIYSEHASNSTHLICVENCIQSIKENTFIWFGLHRSSDLCDPLKPCIMKLIWIAFSLRQFFFILPLFFDCSFVRCEPVITIIMTCFYFNLYGCECFAVFLLLFAVWGQIERRKKNIRNET